MIVGVDPGRNGGLCLMSAEGKILDLFKMPGIGNEIDVATLYFWLEERKKNITITYLEKSQAFPGMAARSQFMVGKAFAYVETCLIILKIPYVLVAPRTWTKVMHVGVNPKLKAKEKSLIIAKRLYPNLEELTKNRTKLHDGLIDSILLCEYGRRVG